MTRHRTAGIADRRGFALIAAIWLMVALAALGMQIAIPARTRRVSVINASEQSRARAAADAGFEHARSRLARRLTVVTPESTLGGSAERNAWRLVEHVLPETIAIGEARYRVALSDAHSRINVNTAGEDVLRRLLSALRIDAGDADRIAQAIADWRDPDDLVRGRGAEREAYLKEGLPVLPRNAPFARVDELRDVRGVTREVFGKLAAMVTIEGSGRVNLNTAPLPVLLALPGFTDEAAAVVLRLRESSVAITSIEQFATSLSSGPRRALLDATAQLLPIASFETREVEAVSEGWIPGTPAHASVRGLFVRSGVAMFAVGRRAE